MGSKALSNVYKLRQVVNARDPAYGAKADGVTDDTVATQLAVDTLSAAGGGRVWLPGPGTYLMDQLRSKTGVVVAGDGVESSKIKQANVANPAVYVLSDITTGQLIGVGLVDLTVEGTGTAGTAAVVKVQASTPYVVTRSDFDFQVENCNTALEIAVTAAQEVYLNTFKIDAVTCAQTAFKTAGVYNQFELTAANCASGQAIEDVSLGSFFYSCITDGRQLFSGQNNVIIGSHVETIFGTAGTYVIGANGYNNTLIDPVVQEVTAAKATAAFYIANFNHLIHPRVWGVNFPQYPIDVAGIDATEGKSIFYGGKMSCTFKLVQYASTAQLDAITFVGDVSSYYGKGEEAFYVELKDDFLGDALSGNWNGRVGTDPQCVAPAIYANQLQGIMRMSTGDDAAGTMAVNGVQLEFDTNWQANQGGLVWEARVRMDAITNVAVFVGLTDQVAALEMPFTLAAGDVLTSNATDAVGVLFDTAADTDNWWLVGVANNVDATKQNTTVAPVAGTYEKWRIEVSAAGVATFYRNGVAMGSAMTGAVATAVALTPVLAAFSRGAASRAIDCDYIFTRGRR